MIINLSLLAVIASCIAIVVYYARHARSGARGALFTLAGCAVIVTIYLFAERLLALLGIMLAVLVICGLLANIAAVIHIRQRCVDNYALAAEQRRPVQGQRSRRATSSLMDD